MSRAMKDSGIPWIGEIPSHWQLLPSKRVFRGQKRIVGESADGYERLALTMRGVIKRDKEDNEGLQPEKFDGYQVLKKNEIVFKLIDLQNEKTSRVGLSPYIGIVSPAYIIISNNQSDNRFYYYWFLDMYYRLIFNKMGDDGVRSSLSMADVLNIPIPSILFKEQQAIADFLDKKCSEIDELISLQEKIIEELKSYKQSVITEAVTKGLNPDVPMKDSGISWIEEIPESWDKQRLKFICDIQTGNQDTQDADKDGEYPFYVRSPYVERSHHYSFEGESILMAGDGAGAGRVFHHVYGKYAVHQRVYRLALLSEASINIDYLFYFLSNLFCREMDRGSAQSTVPSVRLPMLQNFVICIPSLKEQQAISDYLDKKCSEIDSLIALKQDKIEYLKEYKKSIIYEYTTGKKEVQL